LVLVEGGLRVDPYQKERLARPGERGAAAAHFLIELLQTVVLALGLYIGVSLVTDRVRVENISMQPTLYADDLLLVNKVVYDVRPPTYGEIIVFHHSMNPPEDYVKRII
jgi:signal peptidase I